MTRSHPRLRAAVRFVLLAGLLIPVCSVIAQNGPDRPVGPLAQLISALRDILAELDLTAEQRAEVAQILQSEIRGLRDEAPDLQNLPPPQRRQRLATLAGQLISRLREPLTPAQQGTFDQRTAGLLAGFGLATPPTAPPTTRPTAPPVPPGDAMTSPPTPPRVAPTTRPAPPAPRTPTAPNTPTTKPATPDFLAPSPLQVGQHAPDIHTLRLDNARPFTLANLPPRLRLLIFASHSAPTFRDHVPAINQLQRDYRWRVEVFVIYTAEAYPAGVWDIDRNRQDRIRIEPHATLDDRLAVARNARDHLNLEPTVLVDQLSDATASAYGLMPNGAVLLARDGTVLAVQRWFDPHGMRYALDDALRMRPAATSPSSSPVPPAR